MVCVGISDEGAPDYPLKKLDNGYVVPDASVSQVRDAHRQQLRNHVEIGVEADALGFEYVVHPELHFSLLGKSSPNPVLTQTAIATRTDTVRLLQMANILPWHEPVRLAEQIAMLDVLSGGRAEVGIGTGWGTIEAETLGQYWGGTTEHSAMNRASFEEKYEILLDAWTEDLLAHHGQFHDVPPGYVEWEHHQVYHYLDDDGSEYRPEDVFDLDDDPATLRSVPVYPPPAQRPHPQLWRPAMSSSTAEWAARHGMNCCCHCTQFSEVKGRIDAYHAAAAEAGWPDHRPEYDGEPFRRGWDRERRRGLATILNVFNTEVASDDAYERWVRGSEYVLGGSDASFPPPAGDEVDVDVEEKLASVDAPIVGSTEEVIDELARFFETCGYDDLVVFPQVNIFGLTHDDHLEQLRSFARDVVPYFEEQEAS